MASCGREPEAEVSLRSFKVPIQGIPHRAQSHLSLVRIPFPGRTCIRLFSSDVFALCLYVFLIYRLQLSKQSMYGT